MVSVPEKLLENDGTPETRLESSFYAQFPV